METLGLLGFIFGTFAFTQIFTTHEKIKGLESRITELEHTLNDETEEEKL